MTTKHTPTHAFTGMDGTRRWSTCATPPYMPPTCSSVSVTVSIQTHTSQPTPARGPGHTVEAFERRVAGRNRVAAELALHDRLDRAAEEDDPQDGVADLRAEGGGGDELAGADNGRGEHHARPDAGESGRQGCRRQLDRIGGENVQGRPEPFEKRRRGGSRGGHSVGFVQDAPAEPAYSRSVGRGWPAVRAGG